MRKFNLGKLSITILEEMIWASYLENYSQRFLKHKHDNKLTKKKEDEYCHACANARRVDYSKLKTGNGVLQCKPTITNIRYLFG